MFSHIVLLENPRNGYQDFIGAYMRPVPTSKIQYGTFEPSPVTMELCSNVVGVHTLLLRNLYCVFLFDKLDYIIETKRFYQSIVRRSTLQ